MNAENGRTVVPTLAFALLVLLLGRLVRSAAGIVLRGRRDARLAFWGRQGIGVVTGVDSSLTCTRGGAISCREAAGLFGQRTAAGTRPAPLLRLIP